MAAAVGWSSPTLSYVQGTDGLPQIVEDVVKDLQRFMVDDKSDEFPYMPREFVCEVVHNDLKRKRLDLANEDKRPDIPDPKCYEIAVPFLLRRDTLGEVRGEQNAFIWSRSAVKFYKELSNQLNYVELIGNFETYTNPFTKEKELVYSTVPDDLKQIKSKMLRKFYQSALVQKSQENSYLVSSEKLTITWLRSRLDRALNKYREIQRNVHVVATIKQKEGTPLFLRLHVRKTDRRNNKDIKHDVLFSIFPAFRLTKCELLVPVFDTLDEVKLPDETPKKCLFRSVTMCTAELSPRHKHNVFNCTQIGPSTITISKPMTEQAKQTETSSEEKEAYIARIKKARQVTPQQQSQCEQCRNPVSRMLLEYYYQYGHIPEEEMAEARSFVWGILEMLQKSIQKNCKENEPRIVDFVQSGSVSENLKVVLPDEFDVAVKIDLPGSFESYTFITHPSFPTGYVICKVRMSNSLSRSLRKCFKKNEFGHCLDPELLAFGWLLGKLQLAINEYNEKKSEYQADLKLKRGGPALLLEIRPPKSMSAMFPAKISVDLVLALKFGEYDDRYAVAKRAKEEHVYKKIIAAQNRQRESENEYGTRQSQGTSSRQQHDVLWNQHGTPRNQHGTTLNLHGVRLNPREASNNQRELEWDRARKNLKDLWRISYSDQERRYLERVREFQEENNVEGCQDICLKILKTVCTREILKHEASPICHKLSSYILKTALFHVLAERSDWIKDWTMESLADRYVDLLNKLSRWKKLPHFFFKHKNAVILKKRFPDECWYEESSASKNLLDELHATLRIQLLNRFGHIVKTFKEHKQRIDEKYLQLQNDNTDYDYGTFLKNVLQFTSKEDVIHQPFVKTARPDETNKKALVAQEKVDRQVSRAAWEERVSGPNSDPRQNLRRSEEREQITERRQRRAAQRQELDLSSLLAHLRY